MKHFFIRAASAFLAHPIWIFLFGVSLILAITGPFGTFENLSFLGRFIYWTPLVLGANLFARLAARIVDHLCHRVSPLRWQLMMTLVFPSVFSPAVWMFNGLFAGPSMAMPSLAVITIQVFATTVAVGLLTHFMIRDASAVADKPVRLYARLSEGTQASIVRLTVNDHYVEVYLDDAQCQRILMRFSDAVNEMDGTPGFCTHRSHWVAAAHVLRSIRERNREFLLLSDGAKVPVSKTYRETVQAAGFL